MLALPTLYARFSSFIALKSRRMAEDDDDRNLFDDLRDASMGVAPRERATPSKSGEGSRAAIATPSSTGASPASARPRIEDTASSPGEETASHSRVSKTNTELLRRAREAEAKAAELERRIAETERLMSSSPSSRPAPSSDRSPASSSRASAPTAESSRKSSGASSAAAYSRTPPHSSSELHSGDSVSRSDLSKASRPPPYASGVAGKVSDSRVSSSIETVTTSELAELRERLRMAELADLESRRKSSMVSESSAKRARDIAAAEAERVSAAARAAAIERERAAVDALRAEYASLSSTSKLTVAERTRVKAEYNERMKGVDLCFLMDCTGSMGGWINQCKAKISSIMEEARRLNGDTIVRLAFVGYRDFDCAATGNQHEKAEFTPYDRMHELQAALQGIQATGGGDTCEDVEGGLQLVEALQWKSSTKLIIHFGDAPPHGKDFHPVGVAMSDDRPSDSSDLIKEILRKLCQRNIDYYFVELNSSTSRTIEIFRSVYAASGDGNIAGTGEFRTWKLSDASADFLPTVINSISLSISARRGGARSAA